LGQLGFLKALALGLAPPFTFVQFHNYACGLNLLLLGGWERS